MEEYDEFRTGLAKIVNLSDRLVEEDFQLRAYKNIDKERYQGLVADIIKTLTRLNKLLSFSRPSCKWDIDISCKEENSECGQESAHSLTFALANEFALLPSYLTFETL